MWRRAEADPGRSVAELNRLLVPQLRMVVGSEYRHVVRGRLQARESSEVASVERGGCRRRQDSLTEVIDMEPTWTTPEVTQLVCLVVSWVTLGYTGLVWIVVAVDLWRTRRVK